MKKLILGIAVFLAGVQMYGRESIKVFHNKTADLPIISVINTDGKFNNMVITNVNTDKVVLKKEIINESSFHEKMDFVGHGKNEYVIELHGEGEVISKEVVIVNNRVIHNVIDVVEEKPNEMNFFLLDKNKTLLVSHNNGNAEQLNMVIVNLDDNNVIDQINLGKNIAFSYKYDMRKLEEDVSYRVTLYSGENAYNYEFIK